MMMTDKDIRLMQDARTRGSRLGLERMARLLALMSAPQTKMKYVHIAGTNGKGSTGAFIQQVLLNARLRTGFFHSPYVETVYESIRIDNKPAEPELFSDILAFIRQQLTIIEAEGGELPTEYEILTAAAFEYFYRGGCTYVVLEVGLGGKRDATNIIDAPEVAVITSIGKDHTQVLGETARQITTEKGGIIKNGCDVVLYEQAADVSDVIKKICAEQNAALYVTDFAALQPHGFDGYEQAFDYKAYKDLRIALPGVHQYKNAVTAITALERLAARGCPVGEQALRRGLRETRWPCRFELVTRDPFIVIDAAHNTGGVEALVDSLRLYFPGKKIIFVAGILQDKDYAAMLQTIKPLAGLFFAVTPINERALEATVLCEVAAQVGLTAQAADNIAAGIQQALAAANKDAVICIFGSLYVTVPARRWCLKHHTS